MFTPIQPVGVPLTLEQFLSYPRPINNPVSTLTRWYDESNQRPFVVPARLFINADYTILTRLLDDGLDLDLTHYLDAIKIAIRENNYDVVAKLSIAYPNSTRLTIDAFAISPDIVRLLKDKFEVAIDTRTINNYDLCNIQIIMNVIDNLDPDRSLTFCVDKRNELIRQYMKLLRRPIKLRISNNEVIARVNIDNSINDSDLELIDHDNQAQLLSTAINEGDCYLARKILEVVDLTSLSLSRICGLTGLTCLLTLYDEYPELIRNVGSTFLTLVNIDYGLQYCMSESFTKYWSSIDCRDVKNSNAMIELKDKVSNWDQIIELLRARPDDREITLLLSWCKNVIPASESIDNDNVIYLISQIDKLKYRVTDIMSILLRLHEAKLIDIRDYRDEHPYIQFIAERLERVVIIGRRVKNAMNVEYD